MRLWIEMLLVAAATLALFAGATWAAARLLRSAGASRGVRAQQLAIVVRLPLAAALALVLAFTRREHATALVFTVGGTFFAATLFDGVRRFLERERTSCSTR